MNTLTKLTANVKEKISQLDESDQKDFLLDEGLAWDFVAAALEDDLYAVLEEGAEVMRDISASLSEQFYEALAFRLSKPEFSEEEFDEIFELIFDEIVTTLVKQRTQLVSVDSK